MASRGDSSRHASSHHNSKPYERPEVSDSKARRREDASLLGGLFKKARSLFGASSGPTELRTQSPSVTTLDRSSMPFTATAASTPRQAPPAATTRASHRLAGAATPAFSPAVGRTSARGTTPIATLNISPDKSNQSSSIFALPPSVNTNTTRPGSAYTRTQSPFRSPSLTALRLRSPSPDRSAALQLQGPARPGSSIFSDVPPAAAAQRAFSPYKRPLEGSPPPKHEGSLFNNDGNRGLQRSASVASFASSAGASHYGSTASPRKRQMLWDPAHGFVAASAANDRDQMQQQQQPTNEAERILSQLESMSGLAHAHPRGGNSGVSLKSLCLASTLPG